MLNDEQRVDADADADGLIEFATRRGRVPHNGRTGNIAVLSSHSWYIDDNWP